MSESKNFHFVMFELSEKYVFFKLHIKTRVLNEFKKTIYKLNG